MTDDQRLFWDTVRLVAGMTVLLALALIAAAGAGYLTGSLA